MRINALLLNVLLAFACVSQTAPAWSDSPAAETAEKKPWLQFRVTKKNLGKITASRCEFVFPQDVEVKDSMRYVTKDGYAFVTHHTSAGPTLYLADRDGKLVLKTALDHYDNLGRWFVYATEVDETAPPPVESEANSDVPVPPPEPVVFPSGPRVCLYLADGTKKVGFFGAGSLHATFFSRDYSRTFHMEWTTPDSLEGPAIVDSRTGKTLHVYDFRPGRGFGDGSFLATTKDGLVVQEAATGGFRYIGADGKEAWRSPLLLLRRNPNGVQRSPTSRKHILACSRDPTAAMPSKAGEGRPTFDLTVLDLQGRSVWKKPLSTLGDVRVLPDENRLLLRHRDNGPVRELYSLKDGRRLWSVPVEKARCLYDSARLSPNGTRLAFFMRTPRETSAAAPDGRFTFTLALLDLATGAELLREELPFREKTDCRRPPRWIDERTIELMPADYLYRVRLNL
ncbi:MAG: hypothetical protein HQ567_03945 [Candidatus Nealsonbacteria bacterium]|nr:hypothetical protein [Candidatus Nealsonbacteria bacterium]